MNKHPQPKQSSEKPTRGRSGLGAVVLHHTVTALMIALILALGVWAYLTFRKTSFFEAPDANTSSRVEAYAREAQLDRIGFALEVHFRLDGRYPASLDDLVQRGLLLPSDLYYPSGEGVYAYQRTGGGYTLDLKSSN